MRLISVLVLSLPVGKTRKFAVIRHLIVHLTFNFGNIVHYFPVNSDPLDGGFMTSWLKGRVTVADLEGRSQWSLTEISHNSPCFGGRQLLPPDWMAQGHKPTGEGSCSSSGLKWKALIKRTGGRVDERTGTVREAQDNPKQKEGKPTL